MKGKHSWHLFPTKVGLAWLALLTIGDLTAGSDFSRLDLLAPAVRPTATANGSSLDPVISTAGRFVLFTSTAWNLTTNGHPNIAASYLADRLEKTMTPLSAKYPGLAVANQMALGIAMTPDARWIVIESLASNLTPEIDENHAIDLFLLDTVSNRFFLVTHNQDRTKTAESGSTFRSITPDGRLVLFESSAGDLVPQDTNHTTDVFQYDVEARKTILVSTPFPEGGTATNASRNATMSDDGRWVVFESSWSHPAIKPGLQNQVYLRDMVEGINFPVGATLASGTNRLLFNRTYQPDISEDGRYIVCSYTTTYQHGFLWRDRLGAKIMKIPTPDLTVLPSKYRLMSHGGRILFERDQQLYLWAPQEDIVTQLTTNWMGSGSADSHAENVTGSRDGQWLAFTSNATNLVPEFSPGATRIYRKNLVTGELRALPANLQFSGSQSSIGNLQFSSDSRFLVFESNSAEFAQDDHNQDSDVFLYDAEMDSIELISRRGSPRCSATSQGYSRLPPNALSGDGRFLVFESDASNLTPNDGNQQTDVFLKDTLQGAIHLVSVNYAGSAAAHGTSGRPSISRNAQYVSFMSTASDLITPDANTALRPLVPPTQIYLRDLWANKTILVSYQHGSPAIPCKGGARDPLLSPNGQWIGYASRSGDLVGTYSLPSEFVLYEINTRSNLTPATWFTGAPNQVSMNSVGFTQEGKVIYFNGQPSGLYMINLEARSNLVHFSSAYMSAPSFSFDGQRVARTTNASSILQSRVVVYDLNLRSNIYAGPPQSKKPCLNADGRRAAFERIMDNKLQVVVADLDTGTEILASAKFDSDQPANGDSYQALLSASGRHVIFQSRATDLGFTDANDSQDLFLRDLETQTTWLLSRNADGSGSGNSQSLACQLSLDGRVAVFESFASDLVPGDLNQSRDIFMIRLGSPDTDQDGMDDDWEVAYFGNLSEQSGSDYDKDGLSNLEEFKAGTNPTNRESVLRVLMLESVTKGWRTLLWSSQPGKRYQVQFKDELTRANWNSLGEIVLAQDAHCQLVDQMPPSSSQRFYRVKLVE